ncbi:MAG TPA: GNAT family N-acetyltransferase [Allosphingosinicella sp.]|nr:GNAT family N-acetyltransferase [Allosphingosinicella sp.]
MEIRADDLTAPAVLNLLRLHLAGMQDESPPESVHALGAEALRGADVSFWCAWDGEKLLGFGALKALDAGHGEIKSMRTAPGALRRGVGAAMLAHIVAEARARGYRRLSLETGSTPAFDAAIALYARFGFAPCGAFADYRDDDPFSRFMTRAL